MPDAKLPDLYARCGAAEINQIADTDHTGTPDPVLIRRVLADVGSEIDAALSARYVLPLKRVPALLVRIASALAREELYADIPPKEVKEQAKWAREMLKGIADGTLRFEGMETVTGGEMSDARIQPNRTRMEW
jgi:phage gp36-like protein